MQALALATASLGACLRVAARALRRGDVPPLSPPAARAASSFVSALEAERERACEAVGGSCGGGGGARAGGASTASETVFDFYSAGVVVEEEGRLVRSTGGNEHACLAVSFTRGRAAWEFQLVTGEMWCDVV